MYILKSIALLGFLIIIGLSACNTASEAKKTTAPVKTPVDSLYELVVAKHDTVMPKISNMEALQQKLRKQLEALPNAKSSTFRKDSILQLLTGLQKGHDAMFDWMGDFKNTHLHEDFYKNTPEAELMLYLKNEEAKIETVARLMLESMEKSEAFLKE